MDSTIAGAIIDGVSLILATIIGTIIGIVLTKKLNHKDPEEKKIYYIFYIFFSFALIFTASISKRTEPDNALSYEMILPNPATTDAPPVANLIKPTSSPSSVPEYSCPPSDDLVDSYGPDIHYPEKTEYLSECKTMYVDAPGGVSIYAYSSHEAKKELIDEIGHGEMVTVIAENKNNGFSCVIIESTQQVAWVNSSYLSDAPIED